MAYAVSNKETDRKEQLWASEERSAATKGAGTEVRAVAAKTGRSARRDVKKKGSKSVRSARKDVKKNGSKSARSGSKNAAKSVEMALVETVPGEAEPGRAVYAPARAGRCDRVLRRALGLIRTASGGIWCSLRPA